MMQSSAAVYSTMTSIPLPLYNHPSQPSNNGYHQQQIGVNHQLSPFFNSVDAKSTTTDKSHDNQQMMPAPTNKVAQQAMNASNSVYGWANFTTRSATVDFVSHSSVPSMSSLPSLSSLSSNQLQSPRGLQSSSCSVTVTGSQTYVSSSNGEDPSNSSSQLNRRTSKLSLCHRAPSASSSGSAMRWHGPSSSDAQTQSTLHEATLWADDIDQYNDDRDNETHNNDKKEVVPPSLMKLGGTKVLEALVGEEGLVESSSCYQCNHSLLSSCPPLVSRLFWCSLLLFFCVYEQ
jgi:hypothetical protein